MKFKTYTGISWSLLELSGLLEDEDSCVYYERIKKHLGLHPFHLTNLHVALNEILSSNLNFYDAELKGFLLAYKNPKLLTPLGEIFYDTCFIHVDVEADFYIFKPQVGCFMKGIVNKKGETHIGVLVHKAFNVSIPKLDTDENWPGDNIDIGQEVRFAVTHLDFTSKLPFIRGALNPNNYLQGCRLNENLAATCNSGVSFDNDNWNTNENAPSKASNIDSGHKKPGGYFNSDSGSTSDEDLAEIQRKIIQRKGTMVDDTVSNDDSIKESKKDAKKSKVTKEFKTKLIKTESLKNQVSNNISVSCEVNKSGEPVSKKRSIKRLNDQDSPIKTIDGESTKMEKHVKRKALRNSSDTETKEGIVKIKFEKHTDGISSFNNDTDDDVSESTIKSKKHSMKTPTKKRSRKLRISSSEDEDTPISIKIEKTNDMHVHSIKATKKCSIKLESHSSESENESSKKYSPKKRLKKINSDVSQVAARDVKIKTEKVNSGWESIHEEDNKRKNKVLRKNGEAKESMSISNDNVNEDEDKKTKKKIKKNTKRSMEMLNMELDWEHTAVKTEKLDDDEAINSTYKKNETKVPPRSNSPKKKHVPDSDNSHSDDISFQSSTKHPKTTGRDSSAQGIKIKTEKSGTSESPKNKVLKKLGTNHEPKVSTETGSKEHKNLTKDSPNKGSHKSRKSEAGLDFTHTKIKVEKTTES